MPFRLHRRVALAAAALGVSLPGHGLHRLVSRRPSPWVGRFMGLTGRSFGLDVRVEGTPVRSHVLYVANHISWLDILALGGSTGAAFVSKDDVAGWPVVGWLARIGGTIFISRSDRAAVRGQADALGTALASGRPAVLFPEGTTGDGLTLLPFRASLFASLDRAPADIVVQPIAIDYGPAMSRLAWTNGEGAGANAKRILDAPGRIPVTLRFLEPIDVSRGRKAVAATARAEIEAALLESGALVYSAAP
ncbi:lyso-ornithine lipid acyltransferase [Sphingomonas laterariae]|uniref:Lyso-ornithine lipid acyltransferase n=1 Tax=Edaphosphingomonas laterariae TaxID=861865 RepID=A0A239BCM2_9SPHN|nr:lysophospholipid acyltransferase family protein [Sphingomonas laterariae]SNS05765.1 lyso-ornithine lipid acyltransferase [Sphingomonas laterariae]